MPFLVDTNVVSEVRRTHANPAVLNWFRAQPPAALYVSVLTIAEVQRGIERTTDATMRSALEGWLAHQLMAGFRGRILGVDLQIAMRWASLSADASRRGLALQAVDGLLAATAAVHGLTVVTQNVRGFEPLGVPLLNPWDQ